MRKFIIWFVLFQKRILRKPMFQITLLLIPLLIFLLYSFAKDNNALIDVAIFTEDENGYAEDFVENLVNDSTDVVSFYICENEDQLRRDVLMEKVECGYIIPPEIDKLVNEFYRDGDMQNSSLDGIVKVITRNSSVSVKVVNEIVLGEMFSCAAFSILDDFMHEKHFNDMSENDANSKLKGYFNNNRHRHMMFAFEYADGSDNIMLNQSGSNYYMLPVRGMLSVLILVASMSGVIMLDGDDKKGTWGRIRVVKRPFFNYLYILLSVFPVAFCSLIAIFLTGLSTDFVREMLIMSTYMFLAAGFANFIYVFIKSIYVYCTLIPILVVVSLIVCPVFVDFGDIVKPVKFIRSILPTAYYLQSVYSFLNQVKLFFAALLFSSMGIILEKYKPKVKY